MINWLLAHLNAMRFIHWALVVFVVLFLLLLHRMDTKKGNGYALVDNLKDFNTNRADIDKLCIAFFAVLSAWSIVYAQLTNTQVPDALNWVLTIFIIKRLAARFTDAVWRPPPGPQAPPPQPDNSQ